ncbi:MAG: AbrB/MazE/SpoVT family DNA-binding domain-containing protein [Gemmatimonadetes bacterium]|nr:AbrB/MazE/SpoVT family DNA-binding domain-containing protein [Gemmatimonadota bacterium]NNL29405.1 AbrB/MazE/SpoVT family DNA-binding domain-containing protein [Gemmatimonadota bacterium]
MSIVRTSPKGQVVVPADLRKAIGLEPGDLVRVTHAGGRRVVIEPVGDDPVRAAQGLLADGTSLTKALERDREEEDVRSTQKAAGLIRDPGVARRRRGGRTGR